MLQKLLHEASERFSRGAKKKAVKGMHPATRRNRKNMRFFVILTRAKGSFGALVSLEEKQRAASAAKGGRVGQA